MDTPILVVEDNEFSRKLISTALVGKRYIFAKTGREALELFILERPVITFLDIELPDVSGLNVLQRMRKKYPQAYIVMLSSNSDRTTVLNCMKSGARGFIVKPFSRAKLEEYIQKSIVEKVLQSF